MNNSSQADSQTPQDAPTTEETKQADYSYEEINGKTTEQIASEPPKEEVKVEEPKKEETKVEPPKTEEKPSIDPEKMVEEISQKVAEKLTPEEKVEAKDEYDEFVKRINDEKGRPPTWKEAMDYLKQSFKEEQAKEQEEAKKKEEARLAEETKANEELGKRFNAQIDEELEELYSRKEIAPILDKNNPNDQGVIERKSLFAKMLEVNQQRLTEGKPPILSIQRIAYGYWQKPNAQPAGSNAPISMGKGSAPSDIENQEMDYREISKPWSFFKNK